MPRGTLIKQGIISPRLIFLLAPKIKTFTSESHIKTIFRYLSVSCQTVEWNPRSILTCPPPKKNSVKVSYTIFSIFLMTTSISIPLLLLCNLAFELSTIFGRQLRIWRRYVRECSFSKQWPQFTPYKFKCIVFLMVCKLPV